MEKENVNLDKDDNLRSVFLTAREIFYLIDCIRHSKGIVERCENMKGGRKN